MRICEKCGLDVSDCRVCDVCFYDLDNPPLVFPAPRRAGYTVNDACKEIAAQREFESELDQ